MGIDPARRQSLTVEEMQRFNAKYARRETAVRVVGEAAFGAFVTFIIGLPIFGASALAGGLVGALIGLVIWALLGYGTTQLLKSFSVSHSIASIRSRQIPTGVKRSVWRRDGGCCVLCGASENLHYDHDIPFSKGGANTAENIRLLCASCNLRKGARIE